MTQTKVGSARRVRAYHHKRVTRLGGSPFQLSQRFFCKQLATLAYGCDNCIFYTRNNRSARLTWSLQPRLHGFSFFIRPSIWTRLAPIARQAGAHNLEHATPILGLCKGIFTDQFIFSTIWQHFSPRNWKHRPVRVRIHRTIITKRKSKCF